MFSQTCAMFSPKSPLFSQKCATFSPKSPMFFQKCPLFLFDSGLVPKFYNLFFVGESRFVREPCALV